ncbi:MAG: lipoyl(octanoyl) transferase LipB [Dysgonamonadaceae bacterium]|jgi:lipoyl(octanoyl) transferase|nr:lipoyl(octanoyl) transferase LipB [Dysgonamonadaceae bacterium]
MLSEIILEDWGLTPYSVAFERQKGLFDSALERKNSGLPAVNTLVFCEHPHVITLGKHGKAANMLFDEAYLRDIGVECLRTNRGGDITYHGPGQLVCYPVFDLEQFGIGLKEYVFRLEEVVILLLDGYGIKGERLNGASGVWLDTDNPAKVRKISAVGIKSSRYITMHGLSLNVNVDLEYFNLINPCGFTDRGVTSMEKELRTSVSLEDVKARLKEIFYFLFPR